MSGPKHSKKPVQVERIEGFAIMPKHGFDKKYPPSWSFGITEEAAWYSHCNRIMSNKPDYESKGFRAVTVTLVYETTRVRKQNGSTCPRCGQRFGWTKHLQSHVKTCKP